MRICCRRGTSLMDVESFEMPWAGKPYIEYQEKRMALLPEEKALVVARGTRRTSAKKYPKPRRKTPDGYHLVSARGTKILRL